MFFVLLKVLNYVLPRFYLVGRYGLKYDNLECRSYAGFCLVFGRNDEKNVKKVRKQKNGAMKVCKPTLVSRNLFRIDNIFVKNA